MTLTEKRAADRSTMSARLAAIILSAGGAISCDLEWSRHSPRAIMHRITLPNGITITIDFDGASVQPDVHVGTWNLGRGLWKSGTAFRDDNGRPHHKRTVVAHGFEALARALATDAYDFARGGLFHVSEAFRSWLDGLAYLDNAGNYRERDEPKGKSTRIAPWNRYVLELFPDNADFHKAAHAWAAEMAESKFVGMMLDASTSDEERDLVLREACQ